MSIIMLFAIFVVTFVVVFLLSGLIDTLLKNNPSIKRWFLSSLAITSIIFVFIWSSSLI